MADLKYVTYCGLYCRLCSTVGRIPQQASALRESLEKGGWEQFGEFVVPGFKEFWAALETLSELGETCPGCRGGCGAPDCGIRRCAQDRGVEVCSACADFPCERIEQFGRAYPHLIADARYQQEVGLETWVQEQELRCCTGFCHDDIRRPSVPLWGAPEADGGEPRGG